MSTINNSEKIVINFEECLDRLQPVTWIYNNDPKNIRQLGYIAEDVNSVDDLKYLVKLDSNGDPAALRYDLVGVYAVEVIKILSKRISDLEEKINKLEKE